MHRLNAELDVLVHGSDGLGARITQTAGDVRLLPAAPRPARAREGEKEPERCACSGSRGLHQFQHQF